MSQAVYNSMHFRKLLPRTNPEELLVISGDVVLKYVEQKIIPDGYVKLIFPKAMRGIENYRYFFNGRIHRDDGPAVHYWNYTGTIRREFWRYGFYFASTEDWFNSLGEDSQIKALFNLDEWR